MATTKPDYGFGVLSQGEIILDSEQDRLVAKRAWLQLADHLMRHDERLAAHMLPIPWDLAEDPDVRRQKILISQCIRPMIEPGKLKSYIEWDEDEHSMCEQAESLYERTKNRDRHRWLIDQVIASQPESVLNVGAGFGYFDLDVARMGIHVISIAPHEKSLVFAKRVQEEQNLPITWIHDIFENFECEGQVDMVVLGDVLESVPDQGSFIQKACSLAKKDVLITTPFGSLHKGFPIKDPYEVRGQHVRAYSYPTIHQLISSVEGEFAHKVLTLPETQTNKNLTILDMNCFCVHLKRIAGASSTPAEENEPVEVSNA